VLVVRVSALALLLLAMCAGCEPSYYCVTGHVYTRDCQRTKAQCEEVLHGAKQERLPNPNQPLQAAACVGASSAYCFSTDRAEPSLGVIRCYKDIDSCQSSKKWLRHEQGSGPRTFSSCRAGLEPTPVAELE
jgi:hypothetical protein